MGPNKMQPRVFRDLEDLVASCSPTYLKICGIQSRVTGEKGNITAIFKKGKKEDPGNCQPVILTSVPSEIMEQILLEVMLKHGEDGEVIRDSQHGFTKCKTCPTNLVAIYTLVSSVRPLIWSPKLLLLNWRDMDLMGGFDGFNILDG
ncbi:rna-directed dna polymerase from mobile element jockey- hypothetical protein [Limosa lapponica baueri]|uniref:Reverse transcriptase domain-containing protein n=1 Tax=Limosa lapponica baueri TaxID=1758121 RepID=A0A2I0UTE7_LIMLA|nr:rna-directed dna polymerase from mobile element jockey- hypothetical protein [Limosa lapponica baueri]